MVWSQFLDSTVYGKLNICFVLLLKYFLFPSFTEIVGGTGTPYEGGLFSLEVKVPERYIF